jgi:WD40 repeat protein
VLKDHKMQANCLQTLPDGKLASGSADKTIKIWNIETGKCLTTLVGHTEAVLSLCLVDADTLVSTSFDGAIKVWNNLSTRPICSKTIMGHVAPVPMVLLMGMNTIATGSVDKSVRVWDTKTGDCLTTLSGHTSNILCIAWCNFTLLSCDDHQKLRIWSQ